ncbi:discoidin/SUN/FTP domain-containing protein [Hyunsoonleella pacifica]|uniref:Uncharacterized protein n=1 Tax=Hyunsoonleella pacifica TaxID=1080224 RepID=A0A4V2JAP9_9FLAO|nr:hypothetical protein [Hyunsoonleella pacifica]TBN13740.1 hypothetical protein EYD46_14680 [Hyunsoonleella pacifica]GGD25218.1 hypothetical protein GCM10011368_29100 [Hyunsoonleella pacifica]
MLSNIKKIIVLILLFNIKNFSSYAQVGIGTTSPDPSSVLHISSSNRGLLPPIVNLTGTFDVTTVPSPAEGLMVYSPSSNTAIQSGIYIFNGIQWLRLMTEVPTQQRLIRDIIGISNVSFSAYNSYNSYGGYTSLFDDIDNTGAATFHSSRNPSTTVDWGFGINLPSAYTINQIILNGRNDCCTNRIENIIIELYNAGALVHTTTAINTSVTGDNTLNIPSVLADEIRLVVENGGNAGGGGVINFSELTIYAQ